MLICCLCWSVLVFCWCVGVLECCSKSSHRVEGLGAAVEEVDRHRVHRRGDEGLDLRGRGDARHVRARLRSLRRLERLSAVQSGSEQPSAGLSCSKLSPGARTRRAAFRAAQNLLLGRIARI
jgi:hypothetical protein